MWKNAWHTEEVRESVEVSFFQLSPYFSYSLSGTSLLLLALTYYDAKQFHSHACVNDMVCLAQVHFYRKKEMNYKKQPHVHSFY